jgi:UDP-N-acetylmuramoyl-L-alanyl-D-glutamate--2,6-diaminopimelate ligase
LKLTELISPAECPAGPGLRSNPEIAGITADSRTVQPGFLFAALPGARLDGRLFAGEAVARGAVAILTDDAAALDLTSTDPMRLAIVTDPNPHRRLAQLAARFCGRQPRTITAVTGTNGKTSVVHFTREIWTAAGHPAASVGTLGLVTPEGRRPGALTTPDPIALHRDLAGLRAQGIEHVAIEASSHGLAQYRLDGLSIASAAFTNLTRDHLDYHRDMAHYRAAKERLFGELLTLGQPAVLNRDSDEFTGLAALCRDRGHPIISYGTGAAADLRILESRPRDRGQHLHLEIFGRRRDLLLPLLGEFQAMNALCAFGLAIASDTPAAAAASGLARLSGVPGRLEFVGEGAGGAPVIVDYAHTPDALATVLAAVRPHVRERLAVLFGCGGDRDPGKRALMGRIAAGAADRVYVTDDNPRGEDPAEIRRAILAAVPTATEIGDRRRAIESAIADLAAGDLLVIAGKGHETGQIIGGQTLPFDDAEIVRGLIGCRGQPSMHRAGG